MADKTLPEIAATMRELDFCMMTTRGEEGLRARPMSNNREVEFDGDSFFFTDGDSRKVRDLQADPHVQLSYQGPSGDGGRPGIFLSIEGRAELIRDKAAFAEHWQDELKRWWPEGIDSPGLTLLRVEGRRIHWWDDGEGVIELGE